MRYSISHILTKSRHLWTGPSAWIQLIGLIPDEAEINIDLLILELINVPDGRTCGHA